jgi:hypothetical protein
MLAEYPGEAVQEVGLLRDSGAALADGAALRARMSEDGYLFFRGLLPREEVLACRRDFVAILREHGWVDEDQPDGALLGTRAAPARYNPSRVEGMEEYQACFQCWQQLESFHTLPHAPGLLAVLAQLFGEPAFPHPRHIGRLIFPGGEQKDKTNPHQDWFFIQGAAETMTAWVPFGDVPMTHGPLTVLEGSAPAGLQRHHAAAEIGLQGGAGGHGVLVAELEAAGCRWRSADFLAGDVLLFNSLAVHAALPNRSQELRLSGDFRYSGASSELVPSGLLPHLWGLTWEEIYAGAKAKGPWGSDQHQYYWREPATRAALRMVEPLDSLAFAAGPGRGFGVGAACPNAAADGDEPEESERRRRAVAPPVDGVDLPFRRPKL